MRDQFSYDHIVGVLIPGLLSVVLLLPLLPGVALWEYIRQIVPNWGLSIIAVVIIWTTGEMVRALGQGIFYATGWCVGRSIALYRRRFHRQSFDRQWSQAQSESKEEWLQRIADNQDSWWFGCPLLYQILADYCAARLLPHAPRYLTEYRRVVRSELLMLAGREISPTTRNRLQFLTGTSFSFIVVGLAYMFLSTSHVTFHIGYNFESVGSAMVSVGITLHAYATILDRAHARQALVSVYRRLMREDAAFSAQVSEINAAISRSFDVDRKVRPDATNESTAHSLEHSALASKV